MARGLVGAGLTKGFRIAEDGSGSAGLALTKIVGSGPADGPEAGDAVGVAAGADCTADELAFRATADGDVDC